MKKIEDIKKLRELADFPNTSEELLEFLLENKEVNPEEVLFTATQMKDFASLFALIHTEKCMKEVEQHLKEFQYSQKPLLHIIDLKTISEADKFLQELDKEYPNEPRRSLMDVVEDEDLPF